MKKHIVTIILMAMVIITEIVFIAGSDPKHILNSNTSILNHKKNNNTDSSLFTPVLDSLFNCNKKAKLIYFIPDSYNYQKTKHELRTFQNQIGKVQLQNYVWVISNSQNQNSYTKDLAYEFNFNYITIPNLSFQKINIENESVIFIISPELKTLNPQLISKMKLTDIKYYIGKYMETNKIYEVPKNISSILL